MPELPEVETVCRGLRPHIQGKYIDSITLNRPDLRFPFPNNFAYTLSGARIESIVRRAKYILIHTHNGHTLISHLGMSGRMLIQPSDTNRHDHVIFNLENTKIVYRDPRRFGFMDLSRTTELTSNRFLQNLGIDPLSADLTEHYLKESLKNRHSPIKTLLLNQSLLAGLGNIYVCEALFEAGIHPGASGSTLTVRKLTALCSAIQDVLKRAIEAGGSSIQDHRQVNGSLGYFQHSFKVYGREQQPCTRCHHRIERITQAGRSTFFCPRCQEEGVETPF